MDTQNKVIHHGETVVNQPPQGNPPPYSGPGSQYPQPGYPQPGYPQPQPGYPQPQPAYPQPQPAYPQPGFVTGQTQQMHFSSPARQVTVTQAVIVTRNMGPRPTHVTCKSCHAEVVTRVETTATTKTHLFALILCLVGCWPCVCIPYCMDDCMGASHYCPNCNAYLGSYQN